MGGKETFGKDGLSKQDTTPEVIKEQTDTLHKI